MIQQDVISYVRKTNIIYNIIQYLHSYNDSGPGSSKGAGVEAQIASTDRISQSQGSSGLAVPFLELALEGGHVGLVGELVQVRERRGGNSLRDTLQFT